MKPIEMKTIETWNLLSNTDLTAGRGAKIVVGRFSNKEAATYAYQDNRFSKYCVMGYHDPIRNPNPGYNMEHEFLVIHDTAESFWHNSEDEIRKRAIAKLSPEELKALGIK